MKIVTGIDDVFRSVLLKDPIYFIPATFIFSSEEEYNEVVEEMKTMHEMAVAGLLKQGKPSYSGEAAMCQYRMDCGADGIIKCFVGQLIHESVYSENFENKNANNNRVIEALINSGFKHANNNLVNAYLMQAQSIHDAIKLDLTEDEFTKVVQQAYEILESQYITAHRCV